MSNERMLTHAEAADLLQDYLVDELDAHECMEVEQHLRQCEECQQALKEIQHIHALLGMIGKGDTFMDTSQQKTYTSSTTNSMIGQMEEERVSVRSGDDAPAQRNGAIRALRPEQRRRGRYTRSLGLLAACVAMALLVGSFLVVMHMVQQSKQTRTAHGGTATAVSTVKVVAPADPGIYVTMLSYLYRLDKDGKTKIWEQHIMGLTKSVVMNGVVYTCASPGQEGSTVYAFSAKDGKQLWQNKVNTYEQQGPMRASDLNDVVVDEQNVYVIANGGTIYALNKQDGKQRWTYATHTAYQDGSPIHQMALANGTLYASSGNQFYALNPENGKQVWKKSGDRDEMFSWPLIINKTIYISSYVLSPAPGYSRVYALSESGTQLWQTQPINDQFFSAPGSIDNDLYVTGDKTIYDINRLNGTITWQSTVNLTNYQTPVVDQQMLYIVLQGGPDRANGASVIALKRSDGSQVWEKKGMNSPTVHAIDAGVLYVTEQYRGNVYGLKSDDGTALWQYTEPIPNPINPGGSGDTVVVIE